MFFIFNFPGIAMVAVALTIAIGATIKDILLIAEHTNEERIT